MNWSLIISSIITILGWIVAYILGAKLNERNLKNSAKIETIKLIQNINNEVINDIMVNSNLNTDKLARNIRVLRRLFDSVLDRKDYIRYNNILEQCRIDISSIDTYQKDEHQLKQICKNIVSLLGNLDTITILYPFK